MQSDQDSIPQFRQGVGRSLGKKRPATFKLKRRINRFRTKIRVSQKGTLLADVQSGFSNFFVAQDPVAGALFLLFVVSKTFFRRPESRGVVSRLFVDIFVFALASEGRSINVLGNVGLFGRNPFPGKDVVLAAIIEVSNVTPTLHLGDKRWLGFVDRGEIDPGEEGMLFDVDCIVIVNVVRLCRLLNVFLLGQWIQVVLASQPLVDSFVLLRTDTVLPFLQKLADQINRLSGDESVGMLVTGEVQGFQMMLFDVSQPGWLAW